jgi:signal transduction histidine kinase
LNDMLDELERSSRLLEQRVEMSPAIRSRLQIADAQLQRVTRVLRTLLDHARQPSGFETVSLSNVVERVREVAAPRLARSGIRVETSVPGALPSLRADVTQLEMALLNLVTNALDAMAKGGRKPGALTAGRIIEWLNALESCSTSEACCVSRGSLANGRLWPLI